MTRRQFDSVARTYANTRPTYPAEVYGAIAAAAERPFVELTVLDVGAGTGIGTRAMRERGARVVALDPAPRMLAELSALIPDISCLVGDGNALPVADESVDVVTYAQSLHWTDLALSVPEALRVLRPGGILAVWWNVPDFAVAWIASQASRVRIGAPGYHGFAGTELGPKLGEPPFGLPVQNLVFRWGRTVPLERHLDMLGTHSYVAALDEPSRQRLLTAERAALAKEFVSGLVGERYVTRLTIARRDRTTESD